MQKIKRLLGAGSLALALAAGLGFTLQTGAGDVGELVALADAITEQGRGPYADTFTGVRIDGSDHRVELFAKDEGRARELLRAADARHPDVDISRVTVRRSAYTRQELHARMDELTAAGATAPGPDPAIISASPKTDGSGIRVTVAADSVTRIRQQLAADGGIPVDVVAGSPIRPAAS
ncbi:hypothetical protein ACWCQL_36825 [Streptomyces sp. NPDC002073]